MKRSIRTISLAIVTAIISACASGTRKTEPDPVTAIRSATSTVVVRNHQWLDARVYLVTTNGASYRLGIVPSMGAATFKLSPFVHFPDYVKFVFVPLGNAEPVVAGPIDIDVGARLLFTVGAVSTGSSLVKQR